MVMGVVDPLDKLQTGGMSSSGLCQRAPPLAFLASTPRPPCAQRRAACLAPALRLPCFPLSCFGLLCIFTYVPAPPPPPTPAWLSCYRVAKKRPGGAAPAHVGIQAGRPPRPAGGLRLSLLPGVPFPLSVPLASGLACLGHSWGCWEEGWGAQVGLTGQSQRNSTASGIRSQKPNVTRGG